MESCLSVAYFIFGYFLIPYSVSNAKLVQPKNKNVWCRFIAVHMHIHRMGFAARNAGELILYSTKYTVYTYILTSAENIKFV